MERRLYFVVGDTAACVGCGALAGWACRALVTPGWSPVLGMLAGMGLGMLLTLLADFICFLPLFGSMEVMLPSMLTGMLTGMLLGMAAPMGRHPSGADAAGAGAAIGLGVLVATYVADAWIRGREDSWTN